MLKRILCLAVVVIALVSIFAGCGATNTAATKEQAVAPAMANGAAYGGAISGNQNYDVSAYTVDGGTKDADVKFSKNEESKPAADITVTVGSSSVDQVAATDSLANAILSQRKIIRNANVTVEVDDFDIAYGKIRTLIEGFGYIQESNIKKDKVYVDSKEKLVTRGIIIIRVDKDKFESVLAGAKKLGLLIDESIKSDDVTEKFFDIDSRLRLLKYEESRLEQYLNKITDPDTIFKTESRLTDIRHEIESLTGTLKKMGDLVDLSTITINMNEKNPAADKPVKEKSYGERLLGGFAGSFKGVITFCGELIIFLAQALPVLVLLGIIGLISWGAYRKLRKKEKKNTITEDKKDDMET